MNKRTVQARQRNATKEIVRRCWTLLGGLGAGAILLVALLRFGFPLKNCELVNQCRYSNEAIATALGLQSGGQSLLTADFTALEDKLRQALPYIQAAEFSRKLPGTLRVTVTESVPAFALQDGERWWLLDSDCKQLEVVVQRPEGVVTITGGALQNPKPGQIAKWDAPAQADAIALLLPLLEEVGIRGDITGIFLGVDPVPELQYQDRIRIVFGPFAQKGDTGKAAQLRQKLLYAMQAIERESARQKGVVDTSVPGQAIFSPNR
ncbi:MAG: FtsQ-type POTRA domain-containing protein [Oscillospiraceae bacterium]|jgi:hypothetical protein|nr:FtsQ-type POTRA domain-containing protein [Oscillospiraceae bacterium]